MAARSDRGDRYATRHDRSRSYRDRREAVDRGHGNPGNHYGNQHQAFRDRHDRDNRDRENRDRDNRDRDVRDNRDVRNEELPALRRPDPRHREGNARGRPPDLVRGYDEPRHDSRYGYGKGGRHDNYADDRQDRQDRYSRQTDRYDQPDWERFEDRGRFRERHAQNPERDRPDRPDHRDQRPDHRPHHERDGDQRFDRERFDRRPDRDLDREHGFRERSGQASQGGHGGRRHQDEYDMMHHRHGEERRVDHREAEHHGNSQDVANHSRSRRVRKVHFKERQIRKPDVRHNRDREDANTASGKLRDGRRGRPEAARGDYIPPGSDRPRRARDVQAGDRRPKPGQRPRHDRLVRDGKAPQERPRPPKEEAPRAERRPDGAARDAAPEADARTTAPKQTQPSDNQDKRRPQVEQQAQQESKAPGEQPPEASGSAEEGETGSSESSSEDCNSQADFSGSEENFHVAVAEEAQAEVAEGEANCEGAEATKDGGGGSVTEGAGGKNGLSQSGTSRTVPVPKHLCKQVTGLCASQKLDIQDKTDQFARVTVSGSEEEVESILSKIRALGHRTQDAVELCVAKNAQGQPLQGWTPEKIGQATKASVTFTDSEENLRVALQGPPAAVEDAWLLVVKAALGKASQSPGPGS